MKISRTCTTILLFTFAVRLVWTQEANGEWHYFAGDLAASHYSRLTQINKSNVQQLRIAWEWKIGPVPSDNSPHTFEATPLMIDEVLYFPDPYHHVVAVDAKTGEQIWKFDSHLYDWGGSGPGYGISRGIAAWTDGKQWRVIQAARGRLLAIDAKTGKLIPSFANEGVADMTESLVWKVKVPKDYDNTSPPVVYKNLVIVGSAVNDSSTYYQSPPGDVQAFDVRTGKLVWNFHTIPQQGEFGNETWENESWKYTGHANAWPPITVDERNGLVYVPVTEPADDYYGGTRKGDNLFGDSLVCLDANTGKRKWHFQIVHHDLWDYDGVMEPNLVTIHVDGRTIDAVATVSKTGFTYVFDRLTGEPVWPIEERAVPQSDVPGEKTSPTQPFPTKPPPFARQGFTPDDVVDVTPEIKAMALDQLKRYRYGPLFNPPSIQGSIVMPSNIGGANWGGAAVDPEKGVIYVRAQNVVVVEKIIRNFTKDDDLANLKPGPESRRDSMIIVPLIADSIYLNRPPYSTITAIDLNKGEILWQEPNGDMPAIRDNPLPKPTNIPPADISAPVYGKQGSLATAGGLLFNGPGDNKFYAIDKDTGRILWSRELKNPVTGTPMTYRTRSGQQFVVVATGNGKESALVGFTLPAH